MTSLGVSIVSVLCSVLQLLYIGIILWLLHIRRRRLVASARKLPAAIDPKEAPQATITKTGYYKHFLPNSFQSVIGGHELPGGDSMVPNFSYQTADTPLTSSLLHGTPHAHAHTAAAFDSSGGAHEDIGRMSFSASAAATTRLEALYDDEDAFSSPRESTLRGTPYPTQPAILEEEDELSIVLPAQQEDTRNASAFNDDDNEHMQVSLDGDEPQPQNVDLVVGSDESHPAHTMDSQYIPLEPSRSSLGHSSLAQSLSSSSSTLYVSAAPFTVPASAPQSSTLNLSDSYTLMADSYYQPRALRSEPPRAQSRHIFHPKSSSYHRSSGLLDAGGDDALLHAIGTTHHPTTAAAHRRASLTRWMAQQKATDDNASAVGSMPIPSRAVKQQVTPIDPNASPVRSKVKFADENDRTKQHRSAADALKALDGPHLRTDDGGAAPLGDADVAASAVGVSTAPNTTAAAAPTENAPLMPRERKLSSVLKRRETTPHTTVNVSEEKTLVLPIYYRFLFVQCVNCALWCIACVVLLCVGTNLVEWGSDLPNSTTSGHSWIFSVVMSLLMLVQSSVMDGLLVFLAAKNVGRASINFAIGFGIVWGIINAIAVIVVAQTVQPPDEPHTGLLPMWHPFFVRSCACLFITLVVLLLPSPCVCRARARRTDCCRKSREERSLALARQHARWDSHSMRSGYDEELGADDSFDEDDYVDTSPARRTWLYFAAFNVVFHSLVLVLYFLDFQDTSTSDPTWEAILMSVLAFGFMVATPLLYWCLQRDSDHWAREWMAALERMRAEAEIEEQLRAKAREEQARKDGRALPTDRDTSKSSASLARSLSRNFFLDYNILEYGPLLGSGGFSSVYSAKLSGSIDVAVKVLHVRDMSKEVVDQFLHEVSIVLQLVHPNVVSFYGVVFSPPDMVLVMERCRRQSLLHLIKQKKVRFTEFQAVSIGLAIADALRYIHEQDILHRSENEPDA